MKKAFIIIGVIAVIFLGFIWTTYNRLISTYEAINGQWAQVETQYQRRFDLIPNLTESVKGIMKQEKEVFSQLAEARTRYTSAKGANDRAEAATQVEGSLSRLIAIMENYPQLKSSENVQTLMVQLEGTENRISVERKRYNETVQNFNIMIKRFPTNIIAGYLGYKTQTYFESDEGSDKAPTVNL